MEKELESDKLSQTTQCNHNVYIDISESVCARTCEIWSSSQWVVSQQI